MRGNKLGRSVVVESFGYASLHGEINLLAEFLSLCKDLSGLRDEFVFMERITNLAAFGLDEGIAHAAADDEIVHLREEILEHGELAGHLAAADDSGEGALCVLKNGVDSLDFAFHEVAEHLVVREIRGDEGGGGVCTVSGAESVVDVAVSIAGELGGERLLAFLHGLLGCCLFFVGGVFRESAGFAFLFSVVAEILEQKGLAGLEGGGKFIGLLAVGSKLHRHAEALGHMVHDVAQGELGIHFLGPSEVAHDDHGASLFEDLLESGHCADDAGVVGDFEVFVERNVEVYADDGLLSGKIVSVDVLHNIMMICFFQPQI